MIHQSDSPLLGGVKSNLLAKKVVRDREDSLVKCKCQMEKKAANLVPVDPQLYIKKVGN